MIQIAFFGSPGSGKSTAINFLITGSFKGTLPNSSQKGEGCTKFPIRCLFEELNKVELYIIKSDQRREHKNNFEASANGMNEVSIYIDSLNTEQNIEEIIIHIPVRILPKDHLFLKNVKFLDLVGLPDVNTKNSIDLNRKSINREYVDAIAICERQRGMCNADMIRYLSLIDIFSKIREIPIKLFILCIDREEEASRNTEYQRLKCRASIQLSISKAFDYDYRLERSFDDINVENETRLDMKLPVDHKKVDLDEVIDRCDALFITNPMREISINSLKGLISEIKAYKVDNEIKKSLLNIFMMNTVIKTKMKAKMYSVKNEMHPVFRSIHNYFYVNQQYKKLKTQSKTEIIKIFDEHYQEIEGIDIEELYSQYIDTYSFDRLTLHLATLRQQIIQAITDQVSTVLGGHVMKAKSKIQDLLNRGKEHSAEMYDIACSVDEAYFIRFFENIIENKLTRQLNQFFEIRYLTNNTVSENDYLKSVFNEIKVYFENYINNDITDLILGNYSLNRNQLANGIKKIETITRNIEEIDQSINKFQLSRRIRRANTKILREPQLFNSSGSLKIPNKPLVNQEHFSIDTCIKNKWLVGHNKRRLNPNYRSLIDEGKIESKLQIEFNHSTFVSASSIQIIINRSKKSIIADYDTNEIGKRIREYMNRISDQEFLHPIFITSMIRTNKENNARYKDFQPNLILNDICLSKGSYKKLMIFVFIEGGSPENRNKFKRNIEFYKNLVDREFEKVKDPEDSETKNPIITIYLPEENLGIGRKRKIMMLLAEHFNFKRFYFIDDDIQTFLQYDDYERTFINHTNQAFHALKFMSNVLDTSINQLSDFNNEDIFMDWNDMLVPLREIFLKSEYESEFKKVRKLINDKNLLNKEEIGALFSILTNNPLVQDSEAKDILIKLENEIKEKIYSQNIKIIGQIGLLNANSHKQKHLLEDRLRSPSKSTHFISSVRYQVVLFNLEAIRGIHPVSDQAMFEECLSRRDKANLVERAKNKELDNQHAKLAARMGYKYSDKAHVLYQIVNGISGYQVFYYSFKDQTQIPSKVNSDITLNGDEIENDLEEIVID